MGMVQTDTRNQAGEMLLGATRLTDMSGHLVLLMLLPLFMTCATNVALFLEGEEEGDGKGWRGEIPNQSWETEWAGSDKSRLWNGEEQGLSPLVLVVGERASLTKISISFGRLIFVQGEATAHSLLDSRHTFVRLRLAPGARQVYRSERPIVQSR